MAKTKTGGNGDDEEPPFIPNQADKWSAPDDFDDPDPRIPDPRHSEDENEGK